MAAKIGEKRVKDSTASATKGSKGKMATYSRARSTFESTPYHTDVNRGSQDFSSGSH